MTKNCIKGISPIISTVILILIVLATASIIGPWMYHLATTTTNQTGEYGEQQVMCRNAGLSFDSDYGNHQGVNWSATNPNSLTAQITNAGNINLYGFSFEITINSTTIEHYDPTSATQKTASDPLKPGRSAILNVSHTDDWSGSTLNKVKILNTVCPSISTSVDL